MIVLTRALGRRGTLLWLAVLCLCGVDKAGAQVPTVPPPTEQQTADCRRPAFATDQLVCADPALRALDDQLAVRLRTSTLSKSRWTEPQWQWFQRRSRCAFSENHKGCVEAAYRERLALLETPPRVEERRAMICEGADLVAVATQDGKIVLFSTLGEVSGVAWSEPAAKVWTPFLMASRRGEEMRLRTMDGASSRCRIEQGCPLVIGAKPHPLMV